MDQLRLLEPVDGVLRAYVEEVGKATISMGGHPLIEAARHVLAEQADVELVRYVEGRPSHAYFRRRVHH